MWTMSNALLNSLSLPVPAGDSSAPSSSVFDPSAGWNSIPTAKLYWWPDRTTAPCPLSRYGMTSEPLTDGHGKAVLTSFLAAFPVRTSLLPDEEQVFKGSSQDSGWKWPGSLAKWDRLSSSWKTRQLSLLGESTPSSVTWPKWGTMRTGELLEQMTQELDTAAKESGFWPTPTATPYGSNQGGSAGRTGKVRPSLQSMAKQNQWPTPSARDWRSGKASDEVYHSNSRPLNEVVERSESGSLNPDWVEWLMNWPLRWSSLDPLPGERIDEWQCKSLRNMWWLDEPTQTPRVAKNTPYRTDRLKAIGNGQVPQSLALAFECLYRRQHR